MKAAVFHPDRTFTIDEAPMPACELEGVIIKVRACGICGSDLHLYTGGVPGDWTPGHEFAGDIVEAGDKVKNAKTGERVVAMCGRGCGECHWCEQGDWLNCSRMQLLGYGDLPGAMAEYVSVPYYQPGTFAATIPDSISYETAALAEPLSVALYSVTRTGPKPGDTVVVLGAGVIGLCVVKVLRARGITDIILSGRRSGRLAIARESGATTVIDAAKEDIVATVHDITSGRGADVVFDCAGTATTFEQALKCVHRGGRVGLVGLNTASIDWNPVEIVVQNIDLIGCGLKFDLPGAMELMSAGQVDTSSLITHEFPLEQVRDAFETQLNDRDAIKVLVKP